MNMEKAKVECMAAALYDGGWRSEDWEELMEEFEMTAEEAAEICKVLDRYENEK